MSMRIFQPHSAVLLSAAFFCLFTSCKTTKAVTEEEPFSPSDFVYSPREDALSLSESWGFVMKGREDEVIYAAPVTDFAYFAGHLSSEGFLQTIGEKEEVFRDLNRRVHLVIDSGNSILIHFAIAPQYDIRKKLISQIANAAKTYDGLMIDFEFINKKYSADFFSFLKDVKAAIADKPLSVAVHARLKTIASDPYDYKTIASIADRLVIMAYDEHWATSVPGAIASRDWGKKIADYAVSVCPAEKIVMGVPFYGRSWGSDKGANQSWYQTSAERLIREEKISEIERDDGGIPHFSFERTQTITVWYNDATSVRNLIAAYKEAGISKIAFWRLGFEKADIWQQIKAEGFSFEAEEREDDGVEWALK